MNGCAYHEGTMAVDRSGKETFDTVAETYAAMRPGYPQALFEDAIALSGIPPAGRILEVGCGPGTATLALAKRGYDIVGVELGENLARLAEAACRPYPSVRIARAAFEDWPLPAEAFDLVFSASAFHWIDPKAAYVKAAEALGEEGAIALCWNRYPPDETPLRRALDEIYRTVAPELSAKGGAESLETTLQRPADLAMSPCGPTRGAPSTRPTSTSAYSIPTPTTSPCRSRSDGLSVTRFAS